MRVNPGGHIPPSEVIGRDRLIANLWRHLERQGVVLTAERRMGKTSIIKYLTGADVADCIVWVITRPPHVNVDEMVVRPIAQATVRDVARKS